MHYRYCPVCAASLERRSDSLLLCTSCGYRFYQSSKPTANALILRKRAGKKQVLLTRRAAEPFKGTWDLPGGFLAAGEQPASGLRRELKEELGLEVGECRLYFSYVERYPRLDIPEEAQFTLCLFYLIELPEESIPESLPAADDISEAAWFDLDRLPADLSFEGNRKVLNKLRGL